MVRNISNSLTDGATDSKALCEDFRKGKTTVSNGKRQETGWGNVSAVRIISDYHPEYADLCHPKKRAVSSTEKVGKGCKEVFLRKGNRAGKCKIRNQSFPFKLN